MDAEQRGAVNPRGYLAGGGGGKPIHRPGGRRQSLDRLSRTPHPHSPGRVPGGGVHAYPQLFTAMRSPTSRKG